MGDYGNWYLGDTVEYQTQDGRKAGRITDLLGNLAMVVDDDNPTEEREVHLSVLTRVG